MKPNSIEFIYKAMNAIASRKHDPETEQCISDAIEQELLAINASLALDFPYEIGGPTLEMEAYRF